MTLTKLARTTAIAAAALSLGAVPALAEPAHAGHLSNNQCFQTTDWQGWHAISPTVMYMRVHMHDIYQVDFSVGSSQLMWSTNHLINQVRGSDLVCSPIDLDLSVSDGNGFVQPLIAKSIRKLTPEEIAAIPRKDLP